MPESDVHTDSFAASGREAVRVVDAYLKLLMVPDPVAAKRFASPEIKIIFTGGVLMSDPLECAAFNSRRYAWVKKKFDRYEVVEGATPGHAIVYSLGTLYGAWPDGSPFEGNRYVDRYVIENGLITEMHVWNDSAEKLLVRRPP